MQLVKCLKSPVSEDPSIFNMANSPENCTTALSSYYFIALAEIALENVRLSDIWNLVHSMY